ncbi:MAG: TetR/AcrR family transcriptional regulator [Acidobacteriota bacterium]
MARPREFDEEEVLARAMAQFWSSGYELTSVADLEASTGLGRKSFYNAFGNKRTLFLSAIDLFAAVAGERYLSVLEAKGAGLDAIESMMLRMLGDRETEEGANGCLICHTSREPIARDPEVAIRVDKYFARVEAAFAGAIRRELDRRGRDHGLVPELAELMTGVLASLGVLARSPLRQGLLLSYVEQNLAHLRRRITAAE